MTHQGHLKPLHAPSGPSGGGGERPLLPLHSNFLGDLWPFRKRGKKPVAARGEKPWLSMGRVTVECPRPRKFYPPPLTQKLKFNPPSSQIGLLSVRRAKNFLLPPVAFQGLGGGEAGGASKGHLGPLKNAWGSLEGLREP